MLVLKISILGTNSPSNVGSENIACYWFNFATMLNSKIQLLHTFCPFIHSNLFSSSNQKSNSAFFCFQSNLCFPFSIGCFVTGHDSTKSDSIFHIQRYTLMCTLWFSSTCMFTDHFNKRHQPEYVHGHKSNYDYQKCFHGTCKLYGLNVQGPSTNTKWDRTHEKNMCPTSNFALFLSSLYIKDHVSTQYFGSLLEVHSTHLWWYLLWRFYSWWLMAISACLCVVKTRKLVREIGRCNSYNFDERKV